MEIIINVVSVVVDGVEKFQVEDHSRPGARMYGDAPDTGPFETTEEAEAARDKYEQFVQRAVRNDPSLAD